MRINIFKTFSAALSLLLTLLMVFTGCSDKAEGGSAEPSGTKKSGYPVTSESEMRILGVGNSFTEDSMQDLYAIAEEGGYTDILLGKAVYPGCSLMQHSSFMAAGQAKYNLTMCSGATGGEWTTVSETATLESALTAAEWDVIVLQQASGDSGVLSSYEPYLTNLIEYIGGICPKATLCWNMTWAYQQDSTHPEFEKYNNSQSEMYEKIVAALYNVDEHPELVSVIPTGTAIQNLRTTSFGDTATRDGFHLNLEYGRYIAALTWFEALTGKKTEPHADFLTGNQSAEIRKAVEDALAEPRSITPASR